MINHVGDVYLIPTVNTSESKYIIDGLDLLIDNMFYIRLIRDKNIYSDYGLSDNYPGSLKEMIEDKYNTKLIKGDQIYIDPYSNTERKFVLLYNGIKLVYPEVIGLQDGSSLIFPGKDFIFPQDKITDIFKINERDIRHIDNVLITLFNEAIFKDIYIDNIKYTFINEFGEDMKLDKDYYIIRPDPYINYEFDIDLSSENNYIITNNVLLDY